MIIYYKKMEIKKNIFIFWILLRFIKINYKKYIKIYKLINIFKVF